jgi:hypothetical protein
VRDDPGRDRPGLRNVRPGRGQAGPMRRLTVPIT